MAGHDDLKRLMDLAGVTKQRRHRVMILGGGLIGSRVAELLENSVAVRLIEKNEDCAQELSYRLKHTEVLHGDGSDANVLTAAGLLDMDTIVTATGDNETNIMSCLLAKHLMNGDSCNSAANRQGKSITLVNKEDYLVLAATMGSDIALNKKILAANEVLKFIRRGELLSVAHLHGFEAEVVELVAAQGSPITRKPLSKMDPAFYGKIIIGAILRDGEWRIAVGDTHILADERVIVVCTSLHLKDVQRLFLA
jgi:trk system potassium uptake protein TrkA